MYLAAEATHHASLLHDYWQTLSDPAHLLTELTIEAVTAVPGVLYARFWVKRHDRRVHQPEEAS